MTTWKDIAFFFFFLVFSNLLFLKRNNSVYFWLCWVFVAARAFSLVAVCGLTAAVSLVAEHRL